jgi:hypothetical protein
MLDAVIQMLAASASMLMPSSPAMLKTLHASLFNKNLSNEPNFDRIHLAGQYL